MTSFFHSSALNTLHIAYSRYGSYLSVILRRDRLYLQSMYGGLWNDGEELFELNVIDPTGNTLPFEVEVLPERLRLTSETGVVEICVVGKDDALLRGQGVGLRLSRATAERMFDYAFSPDGERWEVNSFDAAIKAGLRKQRGTLQVDAPWERIHTRHITADFLPDEQGIVEGHIHLYSSVWNQNATAMLDFETEAEKNARDFSAWLAATLPVPEQWHKGRETAALINWSSVVAPHGFLRRDTMLMSKDLMNRVWSWDHCFNALALARQNPALAWDQFVLFFDHQDEQGALPDFLGDSLRSFAFCKPPIHGWTLRQLMQIPGLVDDTRLSEIYKPLVNWTQWWFVYRCDSDGLPRYHHGNDSGWDNGTVTAEGLPVQSPDLAAYLVVQMDVLADIALRLGKPDDAAKWTQQADDLLALLIDQLWAGTRFAARHSQTKKVVGGDSALMLVPLILGKRLPPNVRDGLVAEVQRFLTDYGIPSEHVQSPYFEQDGYWSGAIWAPVTYEIVIGLLSCDERDLALEINRRFCEMANRSGMAENFNALTGRGLKDSAYTWTASVFLLLGNLLLQEDFL
jgi:putative isomerase